MKNNKNIEMKIYELLGVRLFRKIAFKLRDMTVAPFASKEIRRKIIKELNSTFNNYNLGKINSFEDIEKFKKQLKFNTIVHLVSLIFAIIGVIIGFNYTLLLAKIIPMVGTVINTYCIMLQRYNYIRINRLIKKNQLRAYQKNNKNKTTNQQLVLNNHKTDDKKKNDNRILLNKTFSNLKTKESIGFVNNNDIFLTSKQEDNNKLNKRKVLRIKRKEL